MLDKKESVSDKILKHAKRKGYLSEGKISNSDASELALHYANKFPKDLELMKKHLDEIRSV